MINTKQGEIEKLKAYINNKDRELNCMKETLLDMEEIKRSNVQYKQDILESNTKRSEL